jgi:thiamine-monophosphate kinase
MGWLLVVINASDLAAAGATPVAFVSAVSAPADLSVERLKRFLAGTSDACTSERLRYVGGNLRESASLGAVGTAIGVRSASLKLSRSGGADGDLVVSVGDGGIFWRDALTIREQRGELDREKSPLFKPRSETKAMCTLAEAGLVRAAMDNSDGLLPTLEQLAAANGLRILLDLDSLGVEGADTLETDPARLWLGWGDWNVVAVVRENDWVEARDLVHAAGCSAFAIGQLEGGGARVELRRGSKRMEAPRLESERFSKDSWFRGGIESYVDLLLNVELP